MGPLSTLTEEARMRTLRDLSERIRATPDWTPDAFADAVQAMLIAGVPAVAVARRAETSVSTVTRWASGAGRPHRITRTAVAAMLPDVIQDHMDNTTCVKQELQAA